MKSSEPAADAWRCRLHPEAGPAPCTRCGTFLCLTCRPAGQCAECEARAPEPVIPLEDASLPLGRRVVHSLRDLILHPLAFFERAARGERLDTPLAVLTVIGSLQACFIVVREWPAELSRESLRGLALVAVLSFATPFLRTGLMAAWFHPLELFFKPGRWFRRTFRAVASSAVFSVLFFVPTYGPGLSALVQFVYSVLGVRSVHRSSRWVWSVVLVVMLLFCFVGFYKVFQATGSR